MNERRDNWAQAFGESVSIAAIGFGLLGITLDHAARFSQREARPWFAAGIMRRSFSASAV